MLYELEARHGVNLGPTYKQLRQQNYANIISQNPSVSSSLQDQVCSFLMDGSTDAGSIEQELVILLSCKKDDTTEEIKSYARFFSVAAPYKADASGLVKCLPQSLSPLGIADVLDQDSVLGAKRKQVLVVGGTDEASVNVAQQNSMRGLMQGAHQWLVILVLCPLS